MPIGVDMPYGLESLAEDSFATEHVRTPLVTHPFFVGEAACNLEDFDSKSRRYRHVVSAESAQSRFRRFSATRIDCPLCGSENVDYEFVLEKAGFSSCNGCQLLFANGAGLANRRERPRVPEPGPLLELRAMVERYAGARPDQCAIVGSASEPGFVNLDVSAIPPERTFDLIVIAGGIAHDNPSELLRAVASALRPHGTLALMMASTASTIARREGASWGPLRSGERYFFNPDNVQLLQTRCGFGDFATFVNVYDFCPQPSKSAISWFRSNMVVLSRPVERADRHVLSVIFPVFNEANTVSESLQRVLDKEIAGVEIEVIVVESNSTDGSRALVERFREHPRVRLVLEDRPRGKGFAVRTGLKHATGEVVLFQDADLEYDIGDYDELVAPLFELRRNFVLGSRHNPSGAAWKIRHFADQPTVATVANLAHVALLFMFNTLYKQRLRDPFTMYKVFRRDCLYGLTFSCNRFDFDFEINIMLLRKGYQPLEIPVNYLSRSFAEGKKVSFFGDPPTWIRAMLKLRRNQLYRF